MSKTEDETYLRKKRPLLTKACESWPPFQHSVQRKFRGVEHYLTTPLADLERNIVRKAMSVSDVTIKVEQTGVGTPKKLFPATPATPLPASKKPTPPPKVLYDKDKYDNLYDWLFEGLSKELATSAEFIQLPLFDIYALWRTIVRKHLQDTPVEFRTALQEMSQTKLQLDEGVEDFASRVKHAVNKLRASTQTLSKEQVFELMEVSTLTLGVPAEYESSVAVLAEDITFEEATRKLRLTQQRLKARDEEGGGGRRGMALAAQAGPGGAPPTTTSPTARWPHHS